MSTPQEREQAHFFAKEMSAEQALAYWPEQYNLLADRHEFTLERLAAVEAALREAHAVYEDECSEWCAEADPSDPDETPPPWHDKWAKYVAARAALGSEAARPEDTT